MSKELVVVSFLLLTILRSGAQVNIEQFGIPSVASNYTCDDLILKKVDDIEGGVFYHNKILLTLSDSAANGGEKVYVAMSADPRDKRVVLLFYTSQSRTIREKVDDIKILFRDGSRTVLDNQYGETNRSGQWVKHLSTKATQAADKVSFSNSYGVSAPYYLKEDIFLKEIQAIRLYHSSGSIDIHLFDRDSKLLQKTLECFYYLFSN